MTDCLLRRDAKWENQMKKLRLTSTPPLTRLRCYPPANSISSLHASVTPLPAHRVKVLISKSANTTYKVSPGPTSKTNVLTPPVVPSTSSFCTQPPIRLEFPIFGASCETVDVLNIIEQCKDILDIRPLPSGELIGTLTTVLRGPALSWWKADRLAVF